MPEIAIPLGKEARLWYGVPTSETECYLYAATLKSEGLEVKGIKDLTLSIDKDDTDTSRRRTEGWEDARESVKRLRLSFNVVNAIDGGVEQAAISVLRKTFGNGTYNGQQLVSGICFYAQACHAAPVTDEPGPQAPEGEGICADFLIVKFERSEPFGDAQEYNVEARMTQAHGRIPGWV